jgi:ferrous iron transport protein A
MRLPECPVGTDAWVVRVGLADGSRHRAAELGLRPGSLVRVTHRAGAGGRVVALGADRVALDARTAAAVEVEPVEAGRPGPAA